jgi:hypothetical protein
VDLRGGLSLFMFAITLVAVGAAVAAWLRPLPEKSATPSEVTFSAQQVADAKANVCAAYWKWPDPVNWSTANESR